MKGILISVVLIWGFYFNAYPQLSRGGIPYSFLANVNELGKNSVEIMPVINIIELLKEDSIDVGRKNMPWRFGKDIDVNYNIHNSGEWLLLDNGDRLWRLAVKSSQAYSLNFIFSRFYIPEGAKLYIYNPDKTSVLGAFTTDNNRSDSLFATTIVKGDEAVIEYFEPFAVTGKGSFQLSKVIHGYRKIFAEEGRNVNYNIKNSKGFGSSGICNININCPEGMTWYNEKRAVAMILQSNNTRICTGTMLNNVREDGKPFFLTAKHCSDGENIGSWIFMFNYESYECQNKEGPVNMTLQGAVMRATDTPSDFSLLELSSPPPVNYNVYYAGWSAIDDIADSCVVIHHPSGDIKKISFDYDSIASSDWDTGVEGSHWKVFNWEKGATERGSSGAGLFNKNHKLIGQLHGGTASCTSLTDDNFGKFSFAWNNASNAANRLSYWLDPDNTGEKVVNGKDFNNPEYNIDAAVTKILSPDTTKNCKDTISPIIIIQNFGLQNLTYADIFYGFDKSDKFLYTWKGNLSYMSSAQINLLPIRVEEGSSRLFIYISNPNKSIDENSKNDSLFITFLTIYQYDLTINLKTDFYAEEVSWELLDSKNNKIFFNNNLFPDSYIENNVCIPQGCYKFIIRDSYGDGMCGQEKYKDTGFVKIMLKDSLIGFINGCSYDSIAEIDFCLINAKVKEKEKFIFYPYENVKGMFYLDYFTFDNSSAELNIYNVTGALVYNDKIFIRDKNILDLRFLKNGIYFVLIRNSKTISVRKVFISR